MVVASPRSGARLLLPTRPHRDETLRVGREVLPRVPARLGARAQLPAAGT